MKKILSFLFVFILCIFSSCSIFCDVYDFTKNSEIQVDVSDIPILKQNNKTYFDYIKYVDDTALNKIYFGSVEDASFVPIYNKYEGFSLYYTNKFGDKLYVTYSLSDPHLIKDAYYILNNKLVTQMPLIEDCKVYMSINYWKKLHNYFFDYYEENCFLYEDIRKFNDVELSDIKLFGLEEIYNQKLLKFKEHIPLKHLKLIKYNSNKRLLKFSLESSKVFFTRIEGSRYYYIKFENDKISFYDNNGSYIIKNDDIYDYFYLEQMETWYVFDVIESEVSHYLDIKTNITNWKFERINGNEINFHGENGGVDILTNIKINNDFSIVFNYIKYGSVVI